MGTMELERLCRQQLGGGPWLFNERIDSDVNPFPMLREPVPGEPAPEPFRPFRVQRIGSMRFINRAEDLCGEDRGPLYVAGYSWEDCAAQLGVVR